MDIEQIVIELKKMSEKIDKLIKLQTNINDENELKNNVNMNESELKNKFIIELQNSN